MFILSNTLSYMQWISPGSKLEDLLSYTITDVIIEKDSGMNPYQSLSKSSGSSSSSEV